MISQETRAQIRRCFYAEHWKIGTIARELGVHPMPFETPFERNASLARNRYGFHRPLRGRGRGSVDLDLREAEEVLTV
jgi:hypothetical protein